MVATSQSTSLHGYTECQQNSASGGHLKRAKATKSKKKEKGGEAFVKCLGGNTQTPKCVEKNWSLETHPLEVTCFEILYKFITYDAELLVIFME